MSKGTANDLPSIVERRKIATGSIVIIAKPRKFPNMTGGYEVGPQGRLRWVEKMIRWFPVICLRRPGGELIPLYRCRSYGRETADEAIEIGLKKWNRMKTNPINNPTQGEF